MRLKDLILKYSLVFLNITLLLSACTTSMKPIIKVVSEDSFNEYEIDDSFEYNKIITRLYFAKNNHWKKVDEFEFEKEKNSYLIFGYNIWEQEERRKFSENQLIVRYGNKSYEYTCIDLKPYEAEYHSYGAYHISQEELTYDENPIYLPKFHGNKEHYSLPKSWIGNDFSNMKLDDYVNTDNVSYYLFTYQLVK